MRNRYVLLADILLIAVAAFGAFALRFDWLFLSHRPEFVPFLVTALLIKPVVFHAFTLYGRYWRYASINDAVAIVLANFAASIAIAIVVTVGLYTRNVFPEFSRMVLLGDSMLTLLAIGGVRLAIRVVAEARDRARSNREADRRNAPRARRVLVVGAGDAGTMVVREMQRNPQLGMTPIGFLDDDRVKVGKRMHNVTVIAPISKLAPTVKEHRVDEVIIAMPTAPGTVLRGIAESCRTAGVASRTIPGFFELLDEQVTIGRLRKIDIADLLRRAPVLTDPGAAAYLRDRTVLITGAGGSIGFELCRQVAHASPGRLVLLGHGENSIFEACNELRDLYPDLKLSAVIADVRDRNRILQVFNNIRPDVVFHAAAHKHVPLMEQNPEEAITNNVFGTKNVVDAALEANTRRLVLISTDKAVSPTSIMGVSKRLASMIVRDAGQRHGRQFVAVRFGNVLGSRGSVVPLLKKQIDKGGPITITHKDMKRFFMTIPEAVHLVLRAGGMGGCGDLFVLNIGQPMRIVDLAEDLIKLSGHKPEDVPIVFTGIRPGEKLEEAMWDRNASVEPTTHPEMLRVNERELETKVDLESLLKALEAAVASGDVLKIDDLLARSISTYISRLGERTAGIDR